MLRVCTIRRLRQRKAGARTCSRTHARTPAHTHLDDLVEKRPIPLGDYVGNLLADTGAGVAADLATKRHPINFKLITLWEKRTIDLAKRLAHLEVLRWQQGVTPVPALVPLPDFEHVSPTQAYSQMQHDMSATGHDLFRL